MLTPVVLLSKKQNYSNLVIPGHSGAVLLIFFLLHDFASLFPSRFEFFPDTDGVPVILFWPEKTFGLKGQGTASGVI